MSHLASRLGAWCLHRGFLAHEAANYRRAGLWFMATGWCTSVAVALR